MSYMAGPAAAILCFDHEFFVEITGITGNLESERKKKLFFLLNEFPCCAAALFLPDCSALQGLFGTHHSHGKKYIPRSGGFSSFFSTTELEQRKALSPRPHSRKSGNYIFRSQYTPCILLRLPSMTKVVSQRNQCNILVIYIFPVEITSHFPYCREMRAKSSHQRYCH